MRIALGVIVLLATLVVGIVVGAYGPSAMKHRRPGERPKATHVPESAVRVSAGRIDAAAGLDAQRDHQEMFRMLRFMQQEIADLRATNSRLATLCGEVLAESRRANADGMGDIASSMNGIRQQLDDAQSEREWAEMERRRRSLQAETDATYRRLTEGLRD